MRSVQLVKSVILFFTFAVLAAPLASGQESSASQATRTVYQLNCGGATVQAVGTVAVLMCIDSVSGYRRAVSILGAGIALNAQLTLDSEIKCDVVDGKLEGRYKGFSGGFGIGFSASGNLWAPYKKYSGNSCTFSNYGPGWGLDAITGSVLMISPEF